MSEIIDVVLLVGALGLVWYYTDQKVNTGNTPVSSPVSTTPAPVSSPIPTTPAPVSSPIPVIPVPVSSPIPVTPAPVSSPIPLKPAPVSSPVPVTPAPISLPIPVVPVPISLNPPNPISLKKPVPPVAGSYECSKSPQLFVVPMGVQGENVYSGYRVSPYDDHASPVKIGNFYYWYRQPVDAAFIAKCGSP